MVENIIRRKELVRDYVDSLQKGYATIFIGAGLSKDSGVPLWKELIAPVAKAIDPKLKIDKITDYYDLCEKFVQLHNQRTPLTNLIIKKLRKDFQPSDNHKILARLPFSNIWTSNFDNLIEKSLTDRGKKVNIISRDIEFTFSSSEQVKLYKVHGCINKMPENLVLTRGDVESYHQNFKQMQQAFEGALAENTFLFLGFGFQDANFKTLLGRLHHHYGRNSRQHYAILPKSTEDYYKYEINDLANYGIRTFLIDDYDEISWILKDIERAYIRNNIFVSGSLKKLDTNEQIKDTDSFFISFPFEKKTKHIDLYNKIFPYNNLDATSEKTEKTDFIEFLSNLGKSISENDFKLFTGFGPGICSPIVEGSAKHFVKHKYYQGVFDALKIFPLPHRFFPEKDQNKYYREGMIGVCGFQIMIRGNTSNSEYCSGTFDEYLIAKGLSRLILREQEEILSEVKVLGSKNEKKSANEIIKKQLNLMAEKFEEDAFMYNRLIREQWKLLTRTIDLCNDQVKLLLNNNDDLIDEKNKVLRSFCKKIKRSRDGFFRNMIEFITIRQNFFFQNYINFETLKEPSVKQISNDQLKKSNITIFKKVDAFFKIISNYENIEEVKELLKKIKKYLGAIYKLIRADLLYLECISITDNIEKIILSDKKIKLNIEKINIEDKNGQIEEIAESFKSQNKIKHSLWEQNLKRLETELQAIDSNDIRENELSYFKTDEANNFDYIIYIRETYKKIRTCFNLRMGFERLKSQRQINKISDFKVQSNDNISTIYDDTEKGIVCTNPFWYNRRDIDQIIDFHQAYFNKYLDFRKKRKMYGEITKIIIDFCEKYKKNEVKTEDELNKVKPKEEDKREEQKIQTLSKSKNLLEKIKHIESNYQVSSYPYRCGTVILPVGCFGGMTYKIWKEERNRFKLRFTNDERFAKVFDDMSEENNKCLKIIKEYKLEYNDLLMRAYDNLGEQIIPINNNLNASETNNSLVNTLEFLKREILFIVNSFYPLTNEIELRKLAFDRFKYCDELAISCEGNIKFRFYNEPPKPTK